MNTKLLNSRLRKGLFLLSELISLYLMFKPRLKISFSNRNASWRSRILKGFSNYLPKTGGKYAYPYFLKRRNDEAGENCYLISNQEQEQDLAEFIDSADYISQQAVAGNKEYATHILFRDNKIAYTLTIKYNFQHQHQIHGKVQADYNELITT